MALRELGLDHRAQSIRTITPVPDPLPIPERPLRCDRVALRPWTDGDLADLLAGAADPLVHRYRHSLPAGADAARIWLAQAEDRRARGVAVELAVCEPRGDRAVGSVSLWGIHRRNRDAMLSWWLGPRGRGRGMATASVRLLAAWAFATLEMARLASQIEDANVASRRVAERCGCHLRGPVARLPGAARRHPCGLPDLRSAPGRAARGGPGPRHPTLGRLATRKRGGRQPSHQPFYALIAASSRTSPRRGNSVSRAMTRRWICAVPS